MKNAIAISLLLFAGAAPAQPHNAFIKGQDLLDWLNVAEAKGAKPTADQTIAGLRAQGYAMGVVDYLSVTQHVCLPPKFEFAALQPLIKRELTSNPAKYLSGSGATYIENAALKAYPCRR
jgi:hypothetical protein